MIRSSETPLVSIIIRTADRPEMLREAIRSVKEQSYTPIELIIVNDGSIDIELLAREEAGGSITTWRYIKMLGKHGRACAANSGLEHASGKYISFLDDDDIILPDHIEKLAQTLENNHDCVLAYTDTICINQDRNKLGEFSGSTDTRMILGSNFIPIHSALFRADVLDQGARFDENLNFYEDWDFWIQLSRIGNFIHTPGTSAIYRQTGYCKSRSGIHEHEHTKKNIILKWWTDWKDDEMLFLSQSFDNLYHERTLLRQARSESEQAMKLLDQIMQSRSWKMTAPLRALSSEVRSIKDALSFCMRYHRGQGGGIKGGTQLLRKAVHSIRASGLQATLRKAAHYGRVRTGTIEFIPPLGLPPTADMEHSTPLTHTDPIDIIVCVHNALNDVRSCLESVLDNTPHPFRIIIVDDGSDLETKTYLMDFAESHKKNVLLLRNDNATGYTLAANRGLRASTSEYVILLNSDTIVSKEWADRLVRCAKSNERIGIVGPLSNTASWQSIPDIEKNGDWADNPLPQEVTISEFSRIVAQDSALIYPAMSFLNGFCLLIKKKVLEDIGYFDEESFRDGYGEENDYCLRARKSGWLLALADDTYIYHAQSKSYTTERRKNLSERSHRVLTQKHGEKIINEGVEQCRHDRVLEGIRAHAKILLERHNLVSKAQTQWSGMRLAFVLPVAKAGGGSNVVLTEIKALSKMGVNATIINLDAHKEGFKASYPSLDIPIIYASSTEEIAEIATKFDAVIATLNTSIYWLSPITQAKNKQPTIGYYVQDFEPYFYKDPHDIQTALNSYRLIDNAILFTKTEWNREEVLKQTGAECRVIGPSVNISLFRPRSRLHPSWPSRPLRICAMLRPSSPHRGPHMTMKVLSACAHKFGESIEIILFGVDPSNPDLHGIEREFKHQLVGLQRPEQLASLFNEIDIFVDFSTYQAMGLTAMEAMACGAAVIVPSKGGAQAYARHLKNSLVIDTEDRQACISALELLITDHDLRIALQMQAIKDIVYFYPEKSAYLMMSALFPTESRS